MNEYLGFGMEFGWAGLIASVLLVSFATVALFRKRSVYAAGMLAWAIFAFSSYPMSVQQTCVQLLFLLSALVPEANTAGRRQSLPVILASSLNLVMDEETFPIYKDIIEFETGRTASVWKGRKYEFSQDYYFFAGDNVLDSKDSRYFGFVPGNFVIGIVKISNDL